MDRLIPARVGINEVGLEGDDGDEGNIGDPRAFIDAIVGILKEKTVE